MYVIREVRIVYKIAEIRKTSRKITFETSVAFSVRKWQYGIQCPTPFRRQRHHISRDEIFSVLKCRSAPQFLRILYENKKIAKTGEQSSISAILCDQNQFITTFMLVTKIILLTKKFLRDQKFVLSYRNDSYISFRSKNSRGHIDGIIIYHIDTTILYHFKVTAMPSERIVCFGILRDLFQPTVLCVIRLVLLLFVRIAHKTAGTP